jgi:uncharacterized membrane protein YkvA (DUF1232 family)
MRMKSIKAFASRLRSDAVTVYYVARDPRTGWLVRILALLVAAYALSPIDLIPDVIPVIGYLDDLLLVPLGIALVIRLTPGEVIDCARRRATQRSARPVSHAAAVVIVVFWAIAAWLLARWLIRVLG